MIDLRRPLGLNFLLMTLLTLAILSAMLGYMVWSRLNLLQTGIEITLKTTPVDPRSMLRGYYARLDYEVGNLNLYSLPEQDTKIIADGFEKNQRVFVKLRQQTDGFWTPLSVSRDAPDLKPGEIYLRGRVNHRSCHTEVITAIRPCTLSVRYGIEKFFAPRQRARRLEELRDTRDPEITALDRRISALRRQFADESRLAREQGEQTSEAVERLGAKLRELNRRRQALSAARSDEQSHRIAVLVKVSPSSGEAAISGLLLEGKKIYEERLF